MLEFEKATPPSDVEPTKATAHLPGLAIEITHRRSPDGDAELISINMQAVPSFEAFGRYVEAANPFAFWARAAQLAWLPWIEAARTMTLPWGVHNSRKPNRTLRWALPRRVVQADSSVLYRISREREGRHSLQRRLNAALRSRWM